MASILPSIPRFIFTILEPLSLVAGFLVPVFNPQNFVNQQIPSTPSNAPLTATSQILVLQLANVYGLVGMIGVGVLYSTTEPIVVRNYLVACAIADVGHLWFTFISMGSHAFLDVLGWNIVAWGNIGAVVVLLIARLLYLAGALGQDRVVEHVQKSVKTK